MISGTLTHARPEGELPQWQTQAWQEPRLVAITAAAIALSLLGERLGWPAALILLFNLTAYAAGGFYGTKGALESLFNERKIDVDMLMVLAAIGAALVDQWHEGALLLFLFSLSNVLQDYAIGRSRQAIRGLFKLYPSEATVMRGGKRQTVKIGEIRVGELVLIQPGERIPVDGVVRGGRSAVNQAPITGESMPVDKVVGDKVFAGTLNTEGVLDVEASKPASDTVLSRIIRMVEEAQDSKAPTERFLDRFEQIYAGVILGSVALFIVIPPALGLVAFSDNFYRAMVLMTVAAPCALVISTPAAFISAIASAARGGVLFKGGAYIETLGDIKAIAFDKTGTLTTGQPEVTDVLAHGSVDTDELLTLAASAEDRSQHPVAKAIVRAAKARSLHLLPVEDFESISGRGVRAIIRGETLTLGSPAFLAQDAALPDDLAAALARLEREGKTLVAVRRGAHWLGVIAVTDQVRHEARDLITALHARGIKVAMLTGDNAEVARSIAAQTGVDLIYADLMPEQKADIVRQIQAEVGPVAMVGDGVNDAPALAAADVGIAMGAAGTDVALETADLVLMGDRLELIPFAINLSRKARRVVWQNLTFAIGVIVVLLISAFAVELPLPLGVLGHEGSTVIVVLNGLFQLLIIPEIMRQRGASLAV